MLMVCHHLNPRLPEDLAFAESRIRPETIAAEDVFHDEGILSMYSSDSQAMGRVGENWLRLWQTADKMKKVRGPLVGDEKNDNGRVLRYLAKFTINPAITHGIANVVGSIGPGKIADLVLWPIPFFGIRPMIIVKGGMIAWAATGDPNASIPTPEPVRYRPMFGAFGGAVAATSLTFVSKASFDRGIASELSLQKELYAVSHTRNLSKSSMVRNAYAPKITVDPETYHVTYDGKLAEVPPAQELSLGRLYRLF